MVKPTQPRDIKPKADEAQVNEGKDSGELNGTKFIITNAVVTLLICIVFVASNYFIVQSSVGAIANKIAGGEVAATDGAEAPAEGEGDAVERGLILDLGEFILNLNDAKAKRYLKVDVAVELSKLETDPQPEAKAAGGHGEGAAVDPMEAFAKEMDQFKPAIRDSVITVLSSKSAEEVSSAEGKDKAKDQIKEGINAVFGGEREVLRVSFGTFIIQ